MQGCMSFSAFPSNTTNAVKPMDKRLTMSDGASAIPPARNFIGIKNNANRHAANHEARWLDGAELFVGAKLLVDSIVTFTKFIDGVERGPID
ncbi:hypothetical protein VspSTUT16_42930 [Vibrio sp. STUT-A16]|nr:hypothetical protein VspSTUT16_42930 [Vibrio sp. STUT-A16]